MKVAAVQMDAEFANVAHNLGKAEAWLRKAADAGAELAVLPEFFTTAAGFSEAMLAAVPQNRRVRARMMQWARELHIAVGGSFIEFDGEHAYNVFLLCLADGSAFEHKKDIPTQFENCYYTHGDIEHILPTPIGSIGVALCWEMIRWDTVSRMRGKVDFVLAGSCWWDLPDDAPPERQPLREYNQQLAAETPARLAALLGAPVVHANHCGKVTASRFPRGEKLQTRQLVGAAQIVSARGEVVASKAFSEGEGLVCAELEPGGGEGAPPPAPHGYWIPDLPESYTNAWYTRNPLGAQYYRDIARKRYKAYNLNETREWPHDNQ